MTNPKSENERGLLTKEQLAEGAIAAAAGVSKMTQMQEIWGIAANVKHSEVATGERPGRVDSEAEDGYGICITPGRGPGAQHGHGNKVPLVDGATGERITKGQLGVCMYCFQERWSATEVKERKKEAAVRAAEAAQEAAIQAELARQRAEELADEAEA
jgi:hypothetical protein